MNDPVKEEKIKQYCAYQERSHQEVRSKLLSMEVYGNELENCMSMLIAENYLNEERYARAIARGKFRVKHWGRIKIKQALKQQQVSDYCIRQAMEEIDEDEYRHTLQALADKKRSTLENEANDFVRQQKLKNYLLQKGYEFEYIMDTLRFKED